ncbi:methyl-accepting chemotaxis protein [Shewanella dokdonensis]|uniref:Methyl-accepting chemotaxis protein n=1 Tax=Shewanella dokdonensis TaxID=712036 RepID=A0ABX8DGJ7_9GAMM|nr:methyl-accepting chemotaxis protein [Shewanella dokdonensis]MCL1075087.1 methyl-accepting chemotaxis protein [Shewanella dokdonensis]QVK23495.1 methyl-accepting chemotaxis protein [Shewanella dokdonensis]
MLSFINNWPLKIKITLTSALLLAVMSFALIWQSMASLDRTINSTLNLDIDGFAQSVSVNLSSWMDDRVQAIEKTAVTLSERPEIAPHIILHQTQQALGFIITYLGTSDGQMLQNDPKVILQNYDPRTRSWYQGAQQRNDLFISDPYTSLTSGKYVVTIAYPVHRDNQLIGIIGGNLTLDTLTETIGKLSIPGKGYALLIDDSDQLIAHPDAKWRRKPASEFSAELAPSKIRALVNGHTIARADINQQDSLLYAVDIPGTRWTFVMVMDRAAVLAPVHEQLITQLAIGSVMLLIAIVIMALMTRVLFRDLEQIRSNLNAIAEGNGDLTKRLPINGTDEIGQLAGSFNRFIAQLHGIISNLRQTATSLQQEADSSASTAHQQHQRVQKHQSELHMVATAITEMASATQEISGNAESTSHQAMDTVSLSEQGRVQVDKSQSSISALADDLGNTGNIIHELHRHSQEISSILSTIAGIADQTNLLALNAAIEAARAGEHGRGFAVVADEVRVLSKRTHDSTKEIEATIEVLQQTTAQAVTAMTHAGDMASESVNDAKAASQILQQINEAVSHINDMAAQIASAAEEQASVTVEINRNTETIREVGDEMSRSSETSSAAAITLKELGADINREVSKFIL